MNEEEEPQGRGVPELIAAYRQGEDRADLFREARYLRYLPGADGDLPWELETALFCARDDPDADWRNGHGNQISIPVAIGEKVGVADLALHAATKYSLVAVLFVLDEHLVLFIGGNNGRTTDAHFWLFDRSREYEALDWNEQISAPALTHFRPKDHNFFGSGTGFEEEQAATIVDDIVRVVQAPRNGEQVIACSDFMHLDAILDNESLHGFRLLDTHEDIINSRCSTDDIRARGFFSFVIGELYSRLCLGKKRYLSYDNPPLSIIQCGEHDESGDGLSEARQVRGRKGTSTGR